MGHTENLELMAMEWLRFGIGCPVALFERNPRNGLGNPDVLGISKAGYLYEIEIKRSVSDFRANALKHHLRDRYAGAKDDWRLKLYPKAFWFLVPHDMDVLSITPEWAGLMRGPTDDEPQTVYVVKKAPRHNASERLSVKEMLRLGRCMANQIFSDAKQIDRWKQKFIDGKWYENCDYADCI
jgi:hypothetical protein